MGRYVQAVWQCRYFWLSLVRMDLRTRYRGSLLGLGWSLLQPLAMTVILCGVFHKIFTVPIREFGPFLMAGLACWNYLLNVTLQGADCFRLAEPYLRQHPAPIAIYPLRTMLGFGFHFLLALAVAVLLTWVLNGFGHPLTLLAVLPGLVLLSVFGWSLAMLAGLANVHFPDTRHMLEVAFQALFYLTPIMYPPGFLRNHGIMSRFFEYNPLTHFLRLLREPIINGQAPSALTFAVAGATTAVLALVAVGSLRLLEKRFIYHL